MKQLLTLIALLSSLLSYSQNSENLGKSFFMKQNYPARICDAVGQNAMDAAHALERNFIVIVEAATENGYVISVPRFSSSAKAEELNAKYVGNIVTKPFVKIRRCRPDKEKVGVLVDPMIYFLIPFSDFDEVCEVLPTKRSFAIGIPTIPAKIRFGNGGTGEDPRFFRFEGNLSLGLSAGYKRSFGVNNRYAWNVLGGFTIASVAIDSSTTKGLINATTNASSFSPHVGLVLDVKSFQFGLYSGIDFLYGEPNSYWTYRNRPWVGIGFGYSLFNTERRSDASQTNGR
jgi:hypothetical protein